MSALSHYIIIHSLLIPSSFEVLFWCTVVLHTWASKLRIFGFPSCVFWGPLIYSSHFITNTCPVQKQSTVECCGSECHIVMCNEMRLGSTLCTKKPGVTLGVLATILLLWTHYAMLQWKRGCLEVTSLFPFRRSKDMREKHTSNQTWWYQA